MGVFGNAIDGLFDSARRLADWVSGSSKKDEQAYQAQQIDRALAYFEDSAKHNVLPSDTNNMLYLQGADLGPRDLSGKNLGWVYLKNARFSGTAIDGTDFNHGTFDNADFTGVKNHQLHNVDFSHTTMESSKMEGLTLSGSTNFEYANLAAASFRHTTFSATTSLSGAYLDQRTDFSGAIIPHPEVTFANVDLTHMSRDHLPSNAQPVFDKQALETHSQKPGIEPGQAPAAKVLLTPDQLTGVVIWGMAALQGSAHKAHDTETLSPNQTPPVSDSRQARTNPKSQ